MSIHRRHRPRKRIRRTSIIFNRPRHPELFNATRTTETQRGRSQTSMDRRTTTIVIQILVLGVVPEVVPSIDVQVSPFSNLTSCRNGEEVSNSIATEGLFTFNFYDNGKITAYQVPRCIFAEPAAKTVMESCDLTESLQSYRDRFREYFIVPINGAYLLIQDRRQLGWPKNDAIVPIHSGSLPTINLTTPHLLTFPETCVLFRDHRALFPTILPCTRLTTEVEGYRIEYAISEPFFSLSLTPARSTEPIHLIFGDLSRVDVKAPYVTGAFILRQTDRDDLMIVGLDLEIRQHVSHASDPAFLEEVLRFRYENITTALGIFQALALKTLTRRRCGSFTSSTHELFFAYGTLIHTAHRTAYRGTVAPSVVFHVQSELVIASAFMRRCFGLDTGGLDYRIAAQLAYETFQKIPAPPDGLFLDLTLALDPKTSFLDDTQIQRLLRIADVRYRTSLTSILDPGRRRDLSRVNELIHRDVNDSHPTRALFLLQTSMCSPREIIHWARALSDYDGRSLSTTYSPCIGSGRRDYTEDGVFRLLRAGRVGPSSPTADTLVTIMKSLRPPNRETFVETACLPDETLYAIVTQPDRTYVISSSYLVKGHAYPVTNTVVGKNLVITSLERSAACQPSKLAKSTLSIAVVRNVTFTERCEFCGSTLMEYDEIEGLNDLMHVATLEDLKTITDPANELLIASPRTHYLLLTGNGTVFEVTDIFVDIRETSVIMVILYVAIGAIMLFAIYRIFRLL